MTDEIHLLGGNRFDDMRIDLPRAYEVQNKVLARRERRSVRVSFPRNALRLGAYVAARQLNLHTLAVDNAVDRGWYEDFADYWINVLGGRPIAAMDFHLLRFAYRVRAQKALDLAWTSDAQHVANWQAPHNIAYTFLLTYRQALHPVRGRLLWRHLKPGMRVLEYGCSLAPFYATWRRFRSHVNAQWVLADIPNFTFHYARHLYGADAEAKLVTIPADRLDDPLQHVDCGFDIIFIQEVFEHLHKPEHVARYLVDRLKPGGLLVFDYITSEAAGLDTPAGLAGRDATLAYLDGALDILEGRLLRDGTSVGVCVGRKKGAQP